MNDKIINRLRAIAEAFFQTLSVPFGSFTAKELAVNIRKGAKGKEPIYIVDADEKDLVEISEGGFSCEFPRHRVFSVLAQFEEVAKIPRKERAKFTQSLAVGGESFYITMPKEATNLANYVSKDETRPALTYVYFDASRSVVVASDSFVLAEYSVHVEGKGESLFINAKHFKKLRGRIKVDVTDEKAIFTTDNGEVYATEQPENLRFPNVLRVYPEVAKNGYIKFSSSAVKQITKFARRLGEYSTLFVEVDENELFARISGDGAQISVELDAPAPQNIYIGVIPTRVQPIFKGWDGGLWISRKGGVLVFDIQSANIAVCMRSDETQKNAVGESFGDMVPALQRHSADVVGAPDVVDVPDVVDAPDVVDEYKPSFRPTTRGSPRQFCKFAFSCVLWRQITKLSYIQTN